MSEYANISRKQCLLMDRSPGCCISLGFLSYEAETAEATRSMLMAASNIPVTVRPNWSPRLLHGWLCSRKHTSNFHSLCRAQTESTAGRGWDEDPVGMLCS